MSLLDVGEKTCRSVYLGAYLRFIIPREWLVLRLALLLVLLLSGDTARCSRSGTKHKRKRRISLLAVVGQVRLLSNQDSVCVSLHDSLRQVAFKLPRKPPSSGCFLSFGRLLRHVE